MDHVSRKTARAKGQMKYPLLKFYHPTQRFFWLIRANIAWLNDLRVLEISFGLFGFGVVLQVYTKTRT